MIYSEEVDRGEPIVVKEIPFEPEDKDINHLEDRIHKIEHQAIVVGTQLAIERLLEARKS
jgi:phosphoribosylglycinamide formyltransferase